MTPKEKAKELLKKFNSEYINETGAGYSPLQKQCATICVDEIIDEFNYHSKLDHKIGFWQKVKIEIQIL